MPTARDFSRQRCLQNSRRNGQTTYAVSAPGDPALLDFVQQRLVADAEYLRRLAAIPVHLCQRLLDERRARPSSPRPGRPLRASPTPRRLASASPSLDRRPRRCARRASRHARREPMLGRRRGATAAGAGAAATPTAALAAAVARRMLRSISANAICSSWRITSRLIMFSSSRMLPGQSYGQEELAQLAGSAAARPAGTCASSAR